MKVRQAVWGGGGGVEEKKRETISREVLFQKNGQRIILTVSIENCKKEDYKDLIPITKVLFKEVIADLETLA